MAGNSKISGLPAVATPVGIDEFEVNQSGVSRKMTRAQIHALESGEHLVLPQVDEAATPTLAFGDGDSGFYEQTDDNIRITIAGIKRWLVAGNNFQGDTTAAPIIRNVSSTATVPNISPSRSDQDTGLGSAGANQLSLIAGAIEGIRVNTAASGVNYLDVTPSATGSPVLVGTAGTDANIDLQLVPKGTGKVSISVGANLWEMSSNSFGNTQTSRGAVLVHEAPTSTNPVFVFSGDADTGIGKDVDNAMSLIAGALECMEVKNIGSAPAVGFYGTGAIVRQTGVAVTAAGIHAACVALGLFTA